VAQPGWLGTLHLVSEQCQFGVCGPLGMLHCGIRAIGSTLDLYGPEVNKKHQSSSFNTEPAWVEFYLRKNLDW
jgi:hypothetical protein